MCFVEELEEIRQKTLHSISIRKNNNQARIVVGMDDCGIAAGARAVLLSIMDELSQKEIYNTTVTQMGCIGLCQYEPIVEVTLPGKEKVTYVNMTPEKAKKVIDEHIINGNVVEEYTLAKAESK